MLKKDIFKTLKYLVYSKTDGEKMPIIISLHGAGSRGEDLDVLLDGALLKHAAKTEEFPFKIYAPLCARDTWFDVYETLLSFLDFVREQERGSDIFLSGVSMGGYCSWQLLESKPDFFKKAIICCGGGMYWNAERIKTPVRAFHGKLDTVVFPEESEKMVNAVNAAGGHAELTVYADCSHDAWTRAFSNEENYGWLLE